MLLAVLGLLTLSSLQVSASTGLPVPDWARVGPMAHRAFAGAILLLAVALVVLAKRRKDVLGVFPLAVTALVVVLAQAGFGMLMASRGQMAWIGAVQAVLMHGVVTVLAVATLWASPAWRKPPVLVENEFRPSLLTMAWWPTVAVAVQVVLGSAYRHGLVGVMPHLAGAMLVAGLLAMAGLMVATAYPDHRVLKASAIRLVWLMAAQVLFGLAALAVRMGGEGWGQNLVLVTTAHIVLGSLTLAACVVLALVIQRHVTDAAVALAASNNVASAEGRTGARLL